MIDCSTSKKKKENILSSLFEKKKKLKWQEQRCQHVF